MATLGTTETEIETETETEDGTGEMTETTQKAEGRNVGRRPPE